MLQQRAGENSQFNGSTTWGFLIPSGNFSV
jgi:hypothetical protein